MPSNNNGWTNQNEKTIKKINKICKKISNESKKYAMLYKNIHSTLMVSTMILTPLAGTLSTLSSVFSMSSSDYDHIFGISAAAISFISSIGLSVLKFAKYNKLSINYTKIYTYYYSLNNNIKRQLSLEKKDRQDYLEYNKWISYHLENLQTEMTKEFQEFPELLKLNMDLNLKINNKMCKMHVFKNTDDDSTNESSNTSLDSQGDTGININSEDKMFIIELDDDTDNEETKDGEDETEDDECDKNSKTTNNILNYTEDRFHDGMMMYEIKRLRN